MKQSLSRFVRRLEHRFYRSLPKKSRRRFDIISILALLAFGFAVSTISIFHFDSLPERVTVGSITPADIVADSSYDVVDETSTKKLRMEAQERVFPVFDLDHSISTEVRSHIEEAFQGARIFLAENSFLDNRNQELSTSLESTLKNEFQERLGITLSQTQYRRLRAGLFPIYIEKAVDRMLADLMQSPVIYDKQELRVAEGRDVSVRQITENGSSVESLMVASDILTLLQAQSDIENRTDLQTLDASDLKIVRQMASDLLRINTTYNSTETDLRRARASESVKSVRVEIHKGDRLAFAGEKLDSWQAALVSKMSESRQVPGQPLVLLTYAFFVVSVSVLLMGAIREFFKVKIARKDMIFLGCVVIATLLQYRAGLFLSDLLGQTRASDISGQALLYAFPLAAGAMMTRMVVGRMRTLVFGVAVAIFLAFQPKGQVDLALIQLVGAIYFAFYLNRGNLQGEVPVQSLSCHHHIRFDHDSSCNYFDIIVLLLLN